MAKSQTKSAKKQARAASKKLAARTLKSSRSSLRDKTLAASILSYEARKKRKK